MKQKIKLTKILQTLTLCMVIASLMLIPALKVYAAGGKCAEADCNGTYDNGFCSICGGYEAPKQVSGTHYAEIKGAYEEYYAIENAGQLYWFSQAVNSGQNTINAVLVADITDNKNVLDGNGQLNSGSTGTFRLWTPIGNKSKPYKGTFDGNNHVVSGLYCTGDMQYAGLLGYVECSMIKNVGVVDSYISPDTAYTGAVVGMALDSNMTNCYNTGNITVMRDNEGVSVLAGGVIGYNVDGNIISCYNTGDINIVGNKDANVQVGGVVGCSLDRYEEGYVLENCYNKGNITAKFPDNTDWVYMSGVIGFNGKCDMINCYNTGDVYVEFSSPAEVAAIFGGLIGDGFDANITNCFNAGSIVIAGNTDGDTFYRGVGVIAGKGDGYNITNCYYNSDVLSGDIVGKDEGNNVTENVLAMTTQQFESGEVAYLLNGSRSQGTAEEPLVWYQTTGTDGVPTMDSTHKVVYYENGKYGNDWPELNISYRTHIQTFGWEGKADDITTWKSNGTMSGTSGKAKRLEGINIVVNPKTADDLLDVGIQYTTHCQSYGWLPWSCDGEMNGTEGEAKRLEAIMIQLTGDQAQAYDVYYRVHAQSYGWLGWAKNGAPAGTAGYAKRLEGIQIVVVKKGEGFNQQMEGITSGRTDAFVAKEGSSPIVNHDPTSNTNPVVPGADEVNVAYRTHVQSFGWQAWKYNGQMSGTSGQAKRLEGINIELRNKDCSGDIVYTTHVQRYGWQGSETDQTKWFKNGQMAGTSGEAKRLEAICVNLTGEMSQKYDIYYRVHAQSYGWLGWAKNGAPAGTAGYAKRLEGIQIVLVPKGGAAPGDYQGIKSVRTEAYVSK